MNKFYKSLVFAGAIFAASLTLHPVEAASSYGDPLLKEGSQGSVVAALQQDLRLLGYFHEAMNTGHFDRETTYAVGAFQKDHGLTPNGMVGASTGPLIEKEIETKFPDGGLPNYNVQIKINHQLIGFPDAQPFIDVTSRTVVPVRLVAENLGFKVSYVDEGTNLQITITGNGKTIVFKTGEKTATVNGSSVSLDEATFVKDGRTYIPLRFVSETLGLQVNWDQVNQIANIVTKPEASLKAVSESPSVISVAESYIGVPYQWGGTTPSGFDCSGFVQYVFAKSGKNTPRTAGEMYASGRQVSSLQPGDLVFFSTYAPGPTHVGIFIGGNQFISATTSHGVHIDSMQNPYWGPRFIGARHL